MRMAREADLDLLVDLMTRFYRESGTPMVAAEARRAFAELIAGPSLGQVWLLEAESTPVGYLVLALGFSLQHGGRDAFVDDLYVLPDHRGQGLGTAALQRANQVCRALGVRAMHLTVAPNNPRALALYLRHGFEPVPMQLLSRRIGTT